MGTDTSEGRSASYARPPGPARVKQQEEQGPYRVGTAEEAGTARKGTGESVTDEGNGHSLAIKFDTHLDKAFY